MTRGLFRYLFIGVKLYSPRLRKSYLSPSDTGELRLLSLRKHNTLNTEFSEREGWPRGRPADLDGTSLRVRDHILWEQFISCGDGQCKRKDTGDERSTMDQ